MLSAFPASWWPVFPDDIFVLALKFRAGIPIMRVGSPCMHTRSKNLGLCNELVDIWGDHAIVCRVGGHWFTRHGGLNQILIQAGRDAGYAVLAEQVVPDMTKINIAFDGSVSFEEARLDLEFFGHPVAPNMLLDGTIRHPAAKSMVRRASVEIGFAAEEGVRAKIKRYPPRNGKEVTACSMETWGRFSETLDATLADLACLASRRQRDRGIQPTKWLDKWRAQIICRLFCTSEELCWMNC